MSLLDTIRQKNPSLRDRSDDELKSIIRQSPEFTTFTDDQFERFVSGPAEPEPVEKGSPGFTGGLAAGVDQVQGMGGGLLMAAGDALESDALWDTGKDIYQRNMEEAGENALGFGFTDIRSAGDAWNWARYTAGNLMPTLAVSVAGGGVGGLAGRALAGQVAKQTAVKAGQALGAFGASAGMETGAIMGETQDLDVSLAHGALAGSLDALLPFQLLRKAGADDVADRAASEISDNVLRDLRARAGQSGREAAGRGSLTGLLTEAPTEGLQGLISQHANYWVENNGESLLQNLDDVDVKAIIDEAAAGGLMGGAVGAPAGIMERSQAQAQVDRIELAREQAAAAGGDALDQIRAAQAAEQETLNDAPVPESEPRAPGTVRNLETGETTQVDLDREAALPGNVDAPLDAPPLSDEQPLPEGLREQNRPQNQPQTDDGTDIADGTTGLAADDLSPFQRNQLRDFGVTDAQLWDMPTNEALAMLDVANRRRQEPQGDLTEQGTGVYRVPVDQIQVDPGQYQFRSRVNKDGVDDRLAGVKKWDDNRAGDILVHRRADGSLFVADGHHRLDLAKRLGQPAVNARILEESEGMDVPAARVEAAMANIADGKAEAIDVAKVFRDVDAPNNEIRDRFDLPRNQVALDGEALANLSDNAFGMVAAGQLSEKDGAAIGAAFDDAAQQEAAIRAFQNGKPNTAFERQLLVNEIKAAGFAQSQGDQGGLFGDDPEEISLLQQRLTVLNSLRQALTFDKKLFSSLNKNADRAGEAGNQIATEANKEITQESAKALDLINRVSTTPALNDMVNRAARRLVDGEKKAPVVRDLKAELRAYEQGNYQPGVDGEGRQGSTPAPGQQPTAGEGLEPGSDQPVPAGDFTGTDQGGQPQGDVTPSLELEPQTEAELAEQERKRREAEQAEAEARRKEEERIRADEQVDDFTLSGSDRPVDVAESQGQGNMFDVMGQPAEPETAPTPAPSGQNAIRIEVNGNSVINGDLKDGGGHSSSVTGKLGIKPDRSISIHTAATLDKFGGKKQDVTKAFKKLIDRARSEGVPLISVVDYVATDSGWNLPAEAIQAAGFKRVSKNGDFYWLDPEYKDQAPSTNPVQDFIDGKRPDAPSVEEQASAEQALTGKEKRKAELESLRSQAAELGIDGAGKSRKELKALIADADSSTKPESKAKPKVSANTIVTDEAAEKARAILKAKLSQMNTGLDPEMYQAGITLTLYHIEKGARTFSAYAKAMVADLGDVAKPYLKQWYMGAKLDPRATGMEGLDKAGYVEDANVDALLSEQADTTPETSPAQAEPTLGESLADTLYQNLEAINDNNAVKRVVAKFNGVKASEVTAQQMKEAQEALEFALVRRAREIVEDSQGQSDRAVFDQLLALYQNQPNLNVRSSGSMQRQAYSTPAPLAFLASRLTGISEVSTVYEPTAGNGMLVIGAPVDNVTANELDDTRAGFLEEMGIDATQEDALTYLPPDKVDSVIMNPPFGRLKGEDGKAKPIKVDGYTIKAIDHAIAAQALKAMKDDGQATLIIGASKAAGEIAAADRTFFNWLYRNYNVTSHFEVDGDLYNRQGAGWPVRVITINGRQASNRISPKSGVVQRAMTWSEVYEQYERGLGAQQSDGGRADDTGGTSQPNAEDGPISTSDSRGQQDQPAGTGSDGRGNAGSPAGRPGSVRSNRPTDGEAADGRGSAGSGQSERPDNGGQLEQQADAESQSAPTAGSADPAPVGGQPAKGKRGELTGSQYQTPYKARSKGKNDAVLTPNNMALPLEQALEQLEKEVGDIDAYVQEKLGYDTLAEMHEAFMGLQVDAVAASIYNIENNKGVIIADQTGVGKGRQAAAIIRYARRVGKIPVFMSVTPNLFSDMYGDLKDIGDHDVKPFIVNAGEKITYKERDVYKAQAGKRHKAALQAMASTGKMPDDADTLFLTYHQIKTDNLQRKVMKKMAENAIFVLDEAHNISGERTSPIPQSKGGGERLTAAGFMFELIKDKPVVYLSATYAKRPDNMPVYYRTDLSQAVDEIDQIAEAVSQGGLPLQAVISNMLAQSGQLFRRERSFDGIKINTSIDTDNTTAHEQLADKVAEGLSAINRADKLFHNVAMEGIKQNEEGVGGSATGAGNRAGNVDHVNFSSVIHNYIGQLLLGLKVERAAEQAVALHKQGVKPVLALENTMESFLAEYVSDMGLEPGDPVDATYNDVLLRALERSRRFSRTRPNGDKEPVQVQLKDLDPLTREAYLEAERVIKALDIQDIPMSPIDLMRYRMEQAGMKASEITGRNLTLDYSTNPPTLAKRDPKERKDKRGTVDSFNAGRLDALVLNVSGSTGLSIHASEKFKDQKPRHMIVAQAPKDINILMQMLGRINRTGQVATPEYTMMGLNIPAEKRPLAVTSKKMKSLNANTSANDKSDTSVDAPDILNKYGDQVVAEYLAANPELANELDLATPVGDGDSEPPVPADLAMKFTGRLARTPVETQKLAYEEVETAYSQLIEYLNKTGQNDLDPQTVDLDARILDSKVVYEGKDPTTIFGGNTTLHKVDAKYQGKPPTGKDVQEALDEALKDTTPKQYASDLILELADHPGRQAMIDRSLEKIDQAEAVIQKAAREDGLQGGEVAEIIEQSKLRDDPKLTKKYQDLDGKYRYAVARAKLTQARLDDSRKRTNQAIEETFLIGDRVMLDLKDDVVTGVVTGVKINTKDKGDAYALSKTRVQFMVNSGIRNVELPLSKLKESAGIYIQKLSKNGSLDDIFKGQDLGGEMRETRYVATGNLIAAAADRKLNGRIVAFTDNQGKTHQGMLLPRRFEDEDFQTAGDGQYMPLRDKSALVKFLKNNPDDLRRAGGVFDPKQVVRMIPKANGKWSITVPKANKEEIGRRVKFNQSLIDAMGMEFYGSGKTMEATFSPSRLGRVAEVLADLIPINALPSLRPQWEKAGGRPASEAIKSFDDSPGTGSGGAPAFMRKRGATARGLSEAQVQATVDAFKNAYPGASNAKFRIHRTAATVPGFDPQRDAGATIAGRYDDKTDTVHLVRTAFDSADQVQAALQEEVLVHKGLGFFALEDRQQLYRDIQAAAGESREVARLWEQTVRDYRDVAKSAGLNEEQANRLYAEELLGSLAQERPNWMKKGWRKLWRGIKRLLVKAGWIQPSIGTAELRDEIQTIAEAFQKGRTAPRRDFSADIRQTPSRNPAVQAFVRTAIDADRDRARRLAEQVDQAYESGDLSLAENLDAELEEIYDRLEAMLSDMEEEGLTRGNDAERAEAQYSRMAGDPELDTEGSLVELLSDRWSDYQREQFGYSLEEVVEGARSDIRDFGGNPDNRTDEQVIEAMKDAFASTGKRRASSRGPKGSFGRRADNPSDIRFSMAGEDGDNGLPLPQADVEETTDEAEIERILAEYGRRQDRQDRGTTVSGGQGAAGWQSETKIRRRSDSGSEPAVVFRGSREGLKPEDFREDRFGFATGHPSAGLGVFFTNRRSDAATYGNPEGFYLDVRKPYVLKQEDLPSFNSQAEATRYRNAIKAKGYDGIVVDYRDEGGPQHVIPFEPDQAITAKKADGSRYRLNGKAKAKILGASIKKAIQGVPELAGARIVETTSQLPEKVQMQMVLEGVDPALVRGLYVDGELYVVAGNIESIQEGIEVAVHEAVGHKGIRGVLGKDLDNVMLRLYRSLPNSPEGRAALAEVKRNYPFLDTNKRDDRIAIAEEMVAHLLEKGHRPKAWQRAVAKIRDLLRKLIPAVAWTYTDVLALGEQSREYLRMRKAGTGDTALRYSLASRERISGGNLFDDFNAADRAAAAKMGPRSAPRRMMDAWKEATTNAGLKIRQGMVDRLAAFKAMDERLLGERMLNEDITRSSWVLGRMANAANGALHAMLHNGRLELDPEQKVLGLKNDDSKGLGSVFAQLASHEDPDSASAEVQRFMGWIAGNRARKLLDEGRENLFTEEEISAMESWDRGTLADGRRRAEVYEQVFAEFQAYRDDILAIADQAGLLRKGMDPDDATLFMAQKHGVRGDLVERVKKARKAAARADDVELVERAEERESQALGELQEALVTELGMAEFDSEYDALTTDQRELWANEFYVPFYRISEDEQKPAGQLSTNGLSRQQAYKRLKGGTQNLNDLLENTMMNFHHLLDASLKNQAAQQAVANARELGMARPVPASNRNTKTSTFILEDGEKVYYQIDDPLVFEALTALSNTGMNSMAMKIMRGFKRLFTNMTTTTPQFMVANLIRDSLQATATNDVSKNAFANVVGGYKSYKDARTRAQMMASGASFNFGHLYGSNPDELRAQLTRDMRGAKLIDGPTAIPDALAKGWQWWNDVNNATENLNRAAIFSQNQDQGKLKAAFESRDLIDFSAHGAWPAIRILIDIVPFLNARIQGLDKIYRSGMKPGASVLKAMFGGGEANVSDRQAAGRFWSVTGALALATIALYLHNEDDEEYQKLEEWQKDTYWFIRFGDQAYFIPKPFEVGAIATMAERITEQFVNDKATGQLFRERMWHMVTDTFAFSPVPQAVQPVLDVYANYDAFTQRPIESMGMERLSPELRKRSSTSKAAEWISTGLNATIGAIGDQETNPFSLSPVQVDHLIGGYLGQVGTWVAGSGDVAWRVATGNENPARRWYEYQPIRRFYKDLGDEDRYTRYGTVFYEGLREAGRAYADVKELREMGRLADAAELAESKQELLRLRTPLNRAQRRLREINRRIDVIRRADLDGELKRQQIDRLRAIKNQIQRAMGERVLEARA